MGAAGGDAPDTIDEAAGSSLFVPSPALVSFSFRLETVNEMFSK
jgi:hypothetical protein